MSGYQFIHIEMYARCASKLAGKARAAKGTKRQESTSDTAWTARQIVAEVRREVGQFSPHIVAQRPEPLFGNVDDLAADLDALELDPPKGMRKDTPILLAGVVSSEWPPDDDRSLEWRMDALEYLHSVYGENLRAVIAHNDEDHDHMHFYVHLTDLKSVKVLHPGHQARKIATDAGEPPQAQTDAYNRAMVAMQDDYYSRVAIRHGQARMGPKRERLGRMEWANRKAEAERIAEVVRTTELDRAAAAELVSIAQQDAHRLKQSAKASAMISKDAADAERKELETQRAELAEDAKLLEQSWDELVQQRQAFQEKMGLASRVLKQIFDRLPQLERKELEPFLSVFDRAREMIQSAKDLIFRRKAAPAP